MKERTEVILVHGLWHQPAHFDRLSDVLRRQGTPVHVPHLHHGSLAADTAVVQEVVDACAGRPVAFDHAVIRAHFWSIEQMRRLLQDAGFAVLEVETRHDPGNRPHAAIAAIAGSRWQEPRTTS